MKMTKNQNHYGLSMDTQIVLQQFLRVTALFMLITPSICLHGALNSK